MKKIQFPKFNSMKITKIEEEFQDGILQVKRTKEKGLFHFLQIFTPISSFAVSIIAIFIVSTDNLSQREFEIEKIKRQEKITSSIKFQSVIGEAVDFSIKAQGNTGTKLPDTIISKYNRIYFGEIQTLFYENSLLKNKAKILRDEINSWTDNDGSGNLKYLNSQISKILNEDINKKIN